MLTENNNKYIKMNRQTFFYGFAIFSMFFGSGNLVFPLTVGINNADNWLIAFIGFFCTGIILPLLGLIVIKLYKGNYENLFSEVGSIAKIAIPLFSVSVMGPFGVIPRCITVAHGGIEYISSDISLVYFSAIFCFTCVVICLNEKYMFNILGKFLTPILLFFLILLIVAGIYNAEPIEHSSAGLGKNFTNGFFEGYATMDIFAALFFSSMVFKQIESANKGLSEKELFKAALAPSILGLSLLSLIYLGFAYLGSHYSEVATDLSGQLILPAITNHILGKNGVIFIAIIMLLSCITTAVALHNIFAKYICSFSAIGEEKFPFILVITTIISFAVSLFDFNGIAKILGPVLEISYPGLIILTISSIITRKYKKVKMVAFYATVIYMIWAVFIL